MTPWQEEKHKEIIALHKELKELTNFDFIIDTSGEYCHIKLNGSVPIYINPKDYSKQYSISLWDKLPYIEYYDKEKVKKELEKEGITEPNKIGVLTKNKITDWVTYLTAIYKRLEVSSQEKEKIVNEFLEDIRKYPELKESTYNNYNYNGKEGHNGTIIRNGIEFTYSIDSRNGYISKKVAVHYKVNNTLEDFDKLSANKF